MALKDNIKSQRTRCEMTLEELAQKVGVSRQTIQRYESGVIKNIPSNNIEKIAVALHTTPEYLMGWTDDPIDYDNPNLVVDMPPDVLKHFNGDVKKALKFYTIRDNEALNERPTFEKKQNSSILLRAEQELSPEKFKQLEEMAEFFLKKENKD